MMTGRIIAPSQQFEMLSAAVDEASMSGDPDEYANLRKKLRLWAERQVQCERRREWLIRIVVVVLFCIWLFWVIRILIRGTL